MKLSEEQNEKRIEYNEYAYSIFKLVTIALLVIQLLNHFILYNPHETMWWVLLSVIVILVFKI